MSHRIIRVNVRENITLNTEFTGAVVTLELRPAQQVE
jgi:hypothetical protein